MTLIIQRAEHRDTQAIHAKLDELVKVQGKARNELILLDQEEPEKIEPHRAEERKEIGRYRTANPDLAMPPRSRADAR